MTAEMSFAVGDADETGGTVVEAEIGSVTAEPNGAQEEETARALEPSLAKLSGLVVAGRVTPGGGLRGMRPRNDTTLPIVSRELLDPILRAFEASVAPLPAQAVGVGAVWQTWTRFIAHGADTLKSATYHLVSTSESTATLEITVVAYLADPMERPREMPPGMALRANRYEAHGNSSVIVDRGGLVPAAWREHIESVASVEGGDAMSPYESTVETTTEWDLLRL
jgi:hypothetical protein